MGTVSDFRPAPWISCPECACIEMEATVIFERNDDGEAYPAHTVISRVRCRQCGHVLDLSPIRPL